MRNPRGLRSNWLVILGALLAVSLLPLPLAQGGEAKTEQPAAAPAEKKAEPPAEAKPAPAEKSAAAKTPAGLVGTVVSVEPNSRTLVADVPHGKGTLTIGAVATDKTKIMAGGKQVAFGSLKPGDRVRIVFHRIPTGDVLTSVTLLRGPKG